MKYTVICGKTVLFTDEQFRTYRKHQNREQYIFGKQEWNAKVYQLEYLPFQIASDYSLPRIPATHWASVRSDSARLSLLPEIFLLLSLSKPLDP